MIDLLVPGALLGALALAVPAVLHLRRPPPPTVRVGSLRHLTERTRRPLRRWQWRDRVLLALRLALLALLTLALARPLWRRAADRSPRCWTLVDPAGEVTGPARERLDARRAAGDTVCLLADRFPRLLPGSLPRPGELPPEPADVWSLLRELDARLPAGSSLTVLSPAPLASLRGERPTLGNVTVDWLETLPLPTRIAAVAGGTAERVNVTGGRPEATLRVLIFHTAARAEDARRLERAVRSALVPGDGTHPEAMVLVNPGPGAFPAAPDWVVCLGGPRPEELAAAAGIADARNLFTDAGDAPQGEGDTPPGLLVAPELSAGPDVRVRQRVLLPPGVPGEATHWTDSTGIPVLAVSRPAKPGGPLRWRFGSRFDPAWNDLTAASALSEVLRTWFYPGTRVVTDPRLAGATQARPQPPGVAGGSPAPWPWPLDAPDPVDLRPWALALATAGFFLERIWAHRRAMVPPSVTSA